MTSSEVFGAGLPDGENSRDGCGVNRSPVSRADCQTEMGTLAANATRGKATSATAKRVAPILERKKAQSGQGGSLHDHFLWCGVRFWFEPGDKPGLGSLGKSSVPFQSPCEMPILRVASALLILVAALVPPTNALTLTLTDWRLAPSLNVSASGSAISSTAFRPSGWYNATLPCTVVACLLQNGLYPDPFYGNNLYAIESSPFDAPWWYRGEFTLPSNTSSGSTVVLRFHGINYRADVWVNGVAVASNATTVGAFRHFSVDISALAAIQGQPSAIAVLVSRPHDMAIECVYVGGRAVRVPATSLSFAAPSRETSASRLSTGPRSPLTRAWGCGTPSTSSSSRGP